MDFSKIIVGEIVVSRRGGAAGLFEVLDAFETNKDEPQHYNSVVLFPFYV